MTVVEVLLYRDAGIHWTLLIIDALGIILVLVSNMSPHSGSIVQEHSKYAPDEQM